MSSLSETRKRDCRSALRRFGELTGRDLSTIPADLTEIRRSLDALHPARVGLTEKTWSNLRSNLLAAFEAAGVGAVLRTNKVCLSPEWAEFRARLADRRSSEGLSRFMRFCSLNQIAPDQVSGDVLGGFGEALRQGTLARRANILERDIALLWNRVAERHPEPRLGKLPLPDNRPPPTRVRLESLPESFRSDLEAHLAWAAGQNPFAEDARSRPLASSSIGLRRGYIQTAVTALCESGTTSAQIGSLADLVRPESFKAVLKRRWAQSGGVANAYDDGMTKALVAIAREWVRPAPEDIAELKRLRSKLPTLTPGLTAKNQSLLRELSDPGTLDKLLRLPDQVWREALRGPPDSSRNLARAQAALAIAILLRAPLRIANLAALAFEDTLFLPRRDDEETIVELPASLMKAREPFTIALPPQLTKMIRQYRVGTLEPMLKATGGGRPRALFDTGSGSAKGKETLSWLIERTIMRRLGLHMTAHQFRHLAAKILLDHDPGAFETVRQLLGQKNIKTTVNHYAGLDTRRAARKHSELLEQRLKRIEQRELSSGRQQRRKATRGGR